MQPVAFFIEIDFDIMSGVAPASNLQYSGLRGEGIRVDENLDRGDERGV